MRETSILKERIVYLDYLRVVATAAVIILHVSATNWYTTDVNGFQWQVFNIFDSLTRWGVPVFVMISGALFLGRDIPVKKIYSKYVLRMGTAFLTWSVIYALLDIGTIDNKLSAVAQGHYHMWYILMIAGIYICIPIINPIIQSEARIKYYLLLSFVFAFVIPEIITLTSDFGNELLKKSIGALSNDLDQMNMHLVLGYIVYFILGYYLSRINIDRKQRTIIYALGLLGFMFTACMDSYVAIKTQSFCDNYYGNFTVNVLLEAIAVFTFFKYRKYDGLKVNTIIQILSKYSFGAYLIHALIIEQLNVRFGLNTLSFTPVLSVLTITLIVCILAFVVSALLNHIPVIKKYIV